MARLFTSASSEYLSVASTPVAAAPLTMACWFRNPTTVVGTQVLFSLMNSGAANDGFFLEKNGSNLKATTIAGGSAAAAQPATSIATANTWFHLAAVFASATDRRAWVNGAAKATNATSKTPSGVNSVIIGARGGSSVTSFAGARIAEVGLWNVALLDEEIAALGAGMSPLKMRSASLVGYWPVWGLHSPEIDLTSGARSMTLSGSPSIADGPLVLPRRRYSYAAYDPAAGGDAAASGSLTTLTLSATDGTAAGGAAASGALTTLTLTAVAGAAAGGAAASGALTTLTLTAVSGSATGAGSGAANASGALTTLTITSIAGSATGSGPTTTTPGTRRASTSGLVRTAATSGLVRTTANG